MRIRLLVVSLAAAAALPSVALAAPPANDNRADAMSIDPLPATVDGTTTDATTEKAEPGTNCGRAGPSVWYHATAASDGRVVVDVAARGDLDVIVDVFKKVRSQTQFVDCDASDAKGQAATDFQATEGTTYLVRVSQVANSVAGNFTLHVSAPIVAARPPGARLPSSGITRSLDRIENPDDAWSVTFHTGSSYRIHLSGRGGSCTTHAVFYAPGTSSFADGTTVGQVSCGGYVLFTPEPGQGGRYPLRVLASRSQRGKQRYHLQVAPAGPDDTAPGIVIHDHRHARGSLQGSRIDVVDLYRFDVVGRSVAFLDLSGGGGDFFLQLLDNRGHRLASGDSSIHRRTRPGHYFVAVRASGNGSGHYTLRYATRAITTTRTTLTGGTGGLRATATTTPGAAGTYEITFERFDPLAGWLFARRVRMHGNGSASATYVPPGVGRYRARSSFLGTKDAAASDSRFAYDELGGPLQQ